jgi:hypothetical protein
MSISDHGIMTEFDGLCALEGRRGRISVGLAISGLLHLLVALLIAFAWPGVMQQGLPSSSPGVIPINLVQLGPERGTASSRQIGVPTALAPDASNQRPRNLAPTRQSPPLQSVLKQPRNEADPNSLAAATPQPSLKIQPPRPVLTVRQRPPSTTGPKIVPALPDLQAELQALAQQQQTQARLEGQANSVMAFNGGDVMPNVSAVYRVKDFIRAQIERHWYLDRPAAGAGDFFVSLHLQLRSDGSVTSAEIIGGESFAASGAYRSAASSLRAAALMSSPLALPPGRYAEVKDIELVFSPKDAIQ